MKKRLIALTMALVFVILLLPQGGLTVLAAEQPTITVESQAASAGSSVDVKVTISGNPGIIGAALTLTYDPALTLKEGKSGEAFRVLTMTEPGSLTSPCKFIWDGQDIFPSDIKDGVILTLTFELSEDAEAGTELPISLSYQPGDVIDRELTRVRPVIVNGGISVLDYVPGDLNEDKSVNILDVILLRRFLAGGYDVTINELAADVNADEQKNAMDVVLMRRFIAGGYKDADGNPLVLLPSPRKCSHTLEAVPFQAPTPIEDGNTAYWHCTKCDTCFSDAQGTQPISLADTVIPRTGTENCDHTIFIMDRIEYNALKSEFSYCGYNENGDRVGGFASGKDFSALYGQRVEAITDRETGEVYTIVPHGSAVVVSGVWGDAESKDDGKKIEINDVEYKCDTEFENVFLFCKDQWDNDIDEDDFDLEAIRVIYPWFTFEAIDNNDNGKIDTLVFYPVTIERVNFVNRTEVRTDAGNKFTFADDEIDAAIGNGDYVVVTRVDAVPTGVNQVVKADVVSGTVGATKNSAEIDSYKVRIDGVWYKAAVDGYPALAQDVELVVFNGYYFDVDRVSPGLNMAVITDTGDYSYKDKTIEMTLMFTDGSQETVPVDELTLFEGLLGDVGTQSTYTAREINSMLNNVAGYYDFLLGTPVFYSVDKGTYTLRELTDSWYDFDTIVDLDGNETDYTGGNFWTTSGSIAVNYDKDKGTVVIMGDEEYDISNDAKIVIDKRDSDTGENDGFTYMTGADFLKKNDQKFDFAVVVLDENDNVAAMVVSSYKNMTTGDEFYGLITDTYVELNDDGDKALFIDMITEDGKLERVETDGSTSGYGSWVGGIISFYSYDDVLSLPDNCEDAATGAIKDIDNSSVSFYDATDNDASYRIKLADDAAIVSVGLDEDDFADSTWEGNALAKAASYWDSDAGAEHYHNNALFVLDDDDKICAIFCDVNGDVGFEDIFA